MGRNPRVLATAARKGKSKMARIVQLGITADMDEKAVDKVVMNLSEAKAIENSDDVDSYIEGQQWYVESLVAFAGLTGKERLDAEYEECYIEQASEEELAAMLEDDFEATG